MNYIIYSVFVLTCSTSLYGSQQDTVKVDMASYFSNKPLSEIFKVSSSDGVSDERVVALKNNPQIAQILLNKIRKYPKVAADHLNNLRIMYERLAPKKEEDVVTSNYIKAEALYTSIHEIAIKDEQFSEIYKTMLAQNPNDQDLVETTEADTIKKVPEPSNVAELESSTLHINEKDVQSNISNPDEIPALEPDPNQEETITTAMSPLPETPVITKSQSNEQDLDDVIIDMSDYDENYSENPSHINTKPNTTSTASPSTQQDESDTEEDTSDSEFNEASSDDQNSHCTGYYSINTDGEEPNSTIHGQFSDYESMESNSDAEKSESSQNAINDNEDNEKYNTAGENEYLSDEKNSMNDTVLEKKSVGSSHSTEQENSDSSNVTDDATTCKVNLDVKGILNSESSQTTKMSLPTTIDLLAYIEKNGNLSLLSFIDEYKELYSSETECLKHCHKLLHDAYDNHHAELMSAIKRTVKSVNNNRIPSSTDDIEYDNEIKSCNEFFTTICKEALDELPPRSLHANPNDYSISPNFFKRYSLTLTAAAVITVVSAYYAYNYWHASEATDTVSAQ